MIEILKEIEKLEKERYIFTEYVQLIEQYKSQIFKDGCVYPSKPSVPPIYHEQPIPNYNEKEYRAKAKEQGAGFSKFRKVVATQAFLYLCNPFTWLLIPFMLIAVLFSWPLSIFTVPRKAYKIYIEECRKIEAENEKAKVIVEQYNRDCIRYQKDMNRYNEFMEKELPAKTEFCEKLTNYVQNYLIEIDKKTNILYDSLGFQLYYKGFIPIHYLTHYLKKNNTTNIQNVVLHLEKQIDIGKIPLDLKTALRFRDAADEPLKTIIQELDNCSESAMQLRHELELHLKGSAIKTDYDVFIKNAIQKYQKYREG